MKNNSKITVSGVLWLGKADKLIDKDIKFRKEYDYIHTMLVRGCIHDQ